MDWISERAGPVQQDIGAAPVITACASRTASSQKAPLSIRYDKPDRRGDRAIRGGGQRTRFSGLQNLSLPGVPFEKLDDGLTPNRNDSRAVNWICRGVKPEVCRLSIPSGVLGFTALHIENVNASKFSRSFTLSVIEKILYRDASVLKGSFSGSSDFPLFLTYNPLNSMAGYFNLTTMRRRYWPLLAPSPPSPLLAAPPSRVAK